MSNYKLGDRVLLPGKVVELIKYAECGVDCAIVETDFGNSIVEGVASLLRDDHRLENHGENRVETLSRAMCRAAGYNPDEKAMRLPPVALANGFVIGNEFFPAWQLYADNASALIDAGLA